MGCVSSKLLKKNLQHELLYGNGDFPNHVVSLTSSTYGALKLDRDQISAVERKREEIGVKIEVLASEKSHPKEGLEVINAWELMGDLEEETPNSNQKSKSPKLIGFRGGKEGRSPFKSLSQVGSPNIGKKLGGKENSNVVTPKGGVMKSSKSSANSSGRHRKASSMESPRTSNSGVLPLRRRSLSPLFDPKLIESIENELSLEREQIKKMISPKRYSNINSLSILSTYEEKCPPKGQNVVVIYTTTLRGIRKTFEDCNVVRKIIESYQIQLIERDVSMDCGFKEELRKLMCTKEVKVPIVFVKGRMIGGANEVVKLEEEGKLEGLFVGIPKVRAVCEGCGGLRFIMCGFCNGSCKVLNEDQSNTIKCGECNENGLVQCPICC